ncbi:kinase-like domain-containing protein [Tribonema minus]|uniref:non-specific serine/threonine protein kinase n=1 Tax=Tribonema minus TaxID=303371 RepID=A0A835YHJ8_9STRA|nr:kinase-like domain-containing protein [Tribonema minus]
MEAAEVISRSASRVLWSLNAIPRRVAPQRNLNALISSKRVNTPGAAAKVYLNPTSMEAVKVVSRGSACAVANVERERRILRATAHPYVVQLIRGYATQRRVYLCLKHAPGGDLFGVLRDLGSLPERLVKLYVAELAAALSHVHKLGYAHRDVKPENVLIDGDGHVKLCDFGLSKRAGDGLRGLHTLCGTAPYAAPEIRRCGGGGGSGGAAAAWGCGYGTAVDWWALGILTYEMLVGSLPWPHDTPNAEPDYELKVPQYLSRGARDLVAALLEPNATLRLGAWGSREVRAHAFFAGMDWQRLARRQVRSPFNPLAARAAAAAASAAAAIPPILAPALAPAQTWNWPPSGSGGGGGGFGNGFGGFSGTGGFTWSSSGGSGDGGGGALSTGSVSSTLSLMSACASPCGGGSGGAAIGVGVWGW